MPCWSSLRVAFSLHCSCGGLPAQNRFTHLHDCHCPLSLILGSYNVFTVLLIFPGPDSGGVPECIARPGSVWLFCSQQSVSKPLFSPLPVFLSLRCSPQCLSDHFIGVAPVIARFKTCKDFFTLFPVVRSFSADTVEELTPPFFGLPVSSHPRKAAAAACTRLRTTAALWALGSFV